MKLKCWNGDNIILDKFPDSKDYKCPECGRVGGLFLESEYYKALEIQEKTLVLGMA